MLRLHPASGFTMIELLVTMTILALLLAIGVPAMGNYLQNSKLASATSALYSALQTARSEAIRANTTAQMALTNTPVETADVANALVPDVNGRHWVVRAASGATFLPVDKRSSAENEGSSGSSALVIAAAASGPAAFDGTIGFNGFGATATGNSYSIDISNPMAGTCVSLGGTIRCRRINVSPGGQITACDPAATTGDSRAC